MKRETKRLLESQRRRSQWAHVSPEDIGDILATAAEAKRLRKENRELLALARLFPEAYPERQWEGMLHEEGCPGVNLFVEERAPAAEVVGDGEECTCDGDFSVGRLRAALKPKRPAIVAAKR